MSNGNIEIRVYTDTFEIERKPADEHLAAQMLYCNEKGRESVRIINKRWYAEAVLREFLKTQLAYEEYLVSKSNYKIAELRRLLKK